MPNEVFLFGSSAVLFVVLGTLLSSLWWRWHSTPLPIAVARPSVALRFKRLLHD
jgi:hypothetical protein